MDRRKDKTIKVLIAILFTVAFIAIITSTGWAVTDVYVTDIYNPTSLIAFQDTIVTAEITNWGDSGNFYLDMYIDGNWVASWLLYMDALTWGTVQVTLIGGLTAGYHEITFCADWCRTEGWTWTGTPDLELTDIYAPTSLVGGEDSTITARITNIGNADAGDFYVAMFIDGAYVDSWLISGGLPAWYYLEFSVTITGGLTAGTHSIKFVADYYNNVPESNEANNERTESWTWTGTPDLELTDIYAPTSLVGGEDSTVTAQITNIGSADAGDFYVAMFIDGSYADSWLVSGGLPAWYYLEFSVTILGGLTAGTHSIKFVADYYNNVPESNEANNERTETWTWTGPDLELTDIYDPTSLVEGEDSTITAQIINIGNADAGPFYVAMFIDGSFQGSWPVGGLPAGYYTEFSVTILGGLTAGTHSITFVADYYDDVSESNEGNNEWTESWTWTGTPDLELTDIYDPTSLVEGEDFTVTAQITNIGSADTGAFYVAMFIDGSFMGSWPESGLPAGYYTEFSVTITGGLTAGSHSITFEADYYDDVSESNEGNNERTETWAWTESGPAPPTGVSAVPGPGSGQVTISWDWSNDPDIDYYRIYRGTSPGSYDGYYDYMPKDWYTGVILSDLTNDTTYYFAMTAIDISGIESGFSNEASAMPTDIGDTEPPTDPANLSIIDPNTGTELELYWDASIDDVEVSYYMVFRLTNNPLVSEYNYDIGFPEFTTLTSFIDYGLSDSDTYYYKVLAVDTSDNWSGLSNLTWDSPDDYLAPSAPPYVDISAGDAFIDLWWTAPVTNTDGSSLYDLAGYNIYRGTISGSYDPTPINGSYPYFGLSYTDTNVINGQTYYYVITAVDDNGNESSASFEVSDTPDVLDDPPLPPDNLNITEKETELLLTWDSNYESDLAGYNVYRGITSGSYTLIATLLPYEWYVDQNVSAGQTYYYVVTAVDEGGNESGSSNEVSGMIGQGEIWILSPTSLNPATLDFGYQGQGIRDEGLEAIEIQLPINYDYNILDRFVSTIYLDVTNSATGELVHTESEWNPYDEPYFYWNGRYSLGPDEGRCVPDGWYDARLYLMLFDYFGPYAETVERRNVQVVGCNASLIGVEITTPITTEMNISNVPEMPDVTFHAEVQPADINIADVTFKWYLELTFNQNGRNDHHRIPASGTVDITGSGDWTPDWGNLIAGGDIHVYVTASVNTSEANDSQSGYQIRGTNPAQAPIFAIADDIEERAVCWQESTHRQFNATRYSGIGWPLYGAPNGWGLMQPDPPRSERQIWHWSENLTWGVGYLGDVHQDAQVYLNNWYDSAVNTPDPDDDWDWDPHTEYPEWVWEDGFSRYNTGDPIYSPNGNGGVRNCSGNEYSNPAGCAYADAVRGHINNPPW